MTRKRKGEIKENKKDFLLLAAISMLATPLFEVFADL